jgi:hypothetical protein
MAQTRRKSARPRFPVGAHVRVKDHIMDPDFPEMPLGGWTGEVTDIQPGSDPVYLVRWNRRTLSRMRKDCRDRCRRDDLCLSHLWLLESDLDPDPEPPPSARRRLSDPDHASTICRSCGAGAIQSAN